jgi:predicted ATP-dependent endonuclease of OLD family
MIKVTAIKLPESFDAYKNTEGEIAEFLDPVSKINIFVGSNNSGKSRFMRELAKQDSYEIKSSDVNLEVVDLEIRNFIEKIRNKFDELKVVEVSHLSLEELSQMEEYLSNSINISEDKFEEIRYFLKRWSEIKSIKIHRTQQGGEANIGSGTLDNLAEMIRLGAVRALSYLDQVPMCSQDDNPSKVYIPTLRGLRHLDTSHTDFYLKRTRQDYFEHQKSDLVTTDEIEEWKRPEIFTGLSLYQRITDLLLGNNSDRRLIFKYQEFISKKLFEGKSVELIPNQKEKVVIVKIGCEKEQPIHHLGDGIQSTIILTFLPFIMQEQTFFFIEEPEIYLHPGLQRKLLDFYSSLKQHTFFLTTHSNHFLDITIDIKDVSIFTFRKVLGESDEEELTPDFTIEAVDSGHESSLELLGVRNSSVFLVNATIWVEGITDRWYLRKMLNSYMDHLAEREELKLKLEEDTHYSFVEYGGANITHLSFLDYEEKPIEVKNLCAKAIVIIDKDGEGKQQRKEDLEKVLGEQLIILPCREVENLLPYEVIKKVVMEYEKDENLMIPEFTYQSYQDEYLGTFIESKILKNAFARKGGYKDKSGTIKNKVDFCNKALPKIQYEDLPDSTREIIKSIYRFIYKQNTNE